MVQVLRENKVAPEFRKAMRKASEAVIAVPFWGQGAVEALGLSSKKRVRIVCNLDQPGCNPEVIADLRALGFKPRTHPRLHAKIYATPSFAIVGSSNASTNGMLMEGATSRGWIEANIACDESFVVATILELFEEIWTSPETRVVSAADIKEARARRALAPANLAAPRSRTFLAACREDPKSFAAVYVAAYDEGLGENGQRRLRELKRHATSQEHTYTASDFRNAWAYQFDGVPKDAWLIDLDCRLSGKAKVHGCSKVTGLRLKVVDETDLTITLRSTVEVLGRKYPISAAEKAQLVGAANKIWERADGVIPLRDVVKIIDEKR